VGKEPMDVPAVLEALNEALPKQLRSALQISLVAGSVLGFEYQGLVTELRRFAEAEIADARRLVEKIATLGGEPTTEVAELRWSADAGEAVDWLIESETEAIEALQNVIPPTGDEGRSEALEHRLEHIIMRKQEQVDFLLRARRRS
jgi:bacterioferritin (cytochrome b1)